MTDLEIVNMALLRLGSATITSFTDTSNPYSVYLETLIQNLREEILREFHWPFACKPFILTALNEESWKSGTDYEIGDICYNASQKYTCITAGRTSLIPLTGTTADITNGTTHWRYDGILSADEGIGMWHRATAYLPDDVMQNAGNIYICITAGTSAATGNGPSSTQSNIVDGTGGTQTTWTYMRSLSFSPEKCGVTYRYIVPRDCLFIVQFGPKSAPYVGEAYFYYSGILMSDYYDPIISYVVKQTNCISWPLTLQHALALRIAHVMSKIITGNENMNLFQEYILLVQKTENSSESEATARPEAQQWFTEIS